jgi:hypothetical protein
MSSEFFFIRPSGLNTRYSALSFDDLVRPRQHVLGNSQSDLLGCIQVDDELEFLRLFHGQIGGLARFY